MTPNRGAFGGNGHNIIKSSREQLIDADQKISRLEAQLKQMEKEAVAGVENIEKLKWMCARQRVAISALGTHYKLTPEDMKAIVQPYFDAEMEEAKKQVDEMKEKFKADIAAGKPVQFTAMDNPDQKGE